MYCTLYNLSVKITNTIPEPLVLFSEAKETIAELTVLEESAAAFNQGKILQYHYFKVLPTLLE